MNANEPAFVANNLAQPNPSAQPWLRLWPGVVILVLQWLIILVPAWIAPVTMAHFMGWMLGSIVGAIALLIWWLFASRLRWADRVICVLVFGVAAAAMLLFCHPSLGVFGLILHALPIATTAWVLWLLVTPSLSWQPRRAGLLIVISLAWAAFILVRMDGVDGSLSSAFSFRWSPTPEEHFLNELASGKSAHAPAVDAQLATLAPVTAEPRPDDWPGFRGAARDGRVIGVKIATDWNQHPPRQLWRHAVGPGWSSFAVVGPRLFTQEQRGEEEAVVCYEVNSGTELWAHRDAARFSEPLAGPGPRATPTFHNGKIYALGAAGKLNCLDAVTGKVLWSRDIAADAGAKVPTWGFSASPLVVQGIVTVFAGGPAGKSVLGYKASSGEPAWSAGEGQLSYCSLQPAMLDGVEQLIVSTDRGLSAFQPIGGNVLWCYNWPVDKMYRVVQPTLVGDSDVLIGTGMGLGTRRLHVRHDGNAWAAQEVWNTLSIKPYYNDMVVHRNYIYGFDTDLLTCIDLNDGKRKWKAKGYGNGQVLLLADQDMLLVLSEKGEVALVETNPESHVQKAKFQALEGKTWNHPVIAHGKLFVRNGAEAACYSLAEDSGPGQ